MMWKEVLVTYLELLFWHLSSGIKDTANKPQQEQRILGMRFEPGKFHTRNRAPATLPKSRCRALERVERYTYALHIPP